MVFPLNLNGPLFTLEQSFALLMPVVHSRHKQWLCLLHLFNLNNYILNKFSFYKLKLQKSTEREEDIKSIDVNR